jgi:hypothetical protein
VKVLVELLFKLVMEFIEARRGLQDLIKSGSFLARFLADMKNVGSLGIGCVACLVGS